MNSRNSGSTNSSRDDGPDVGKMVRDAYAKLAECDTGPVRIAAIRAEIGDRASAAAVTDAITGMSRDDGVHVRAEVNQQALTPADRDAGVKLGPDVRHNLQIEPHVLAGTPRVRPQPTPGPPRARDTAPPETSCDPDDLDDDLGVQP